MLGDDAVYSQESYIPERERGKGAGAGGRRERETIFFNKEGF